MRINKSSNFILIWILAFMSALAPLATDMYLPSMSAVQDSFQTTQASVQLSITVFFVAFAFGQLLYGPISDAFGRRKPLIFGIIIYTAASFACAAVNSIHLFVLFRFLQALGGCAGVVIARAIINDKFDIKQGASVMAIMMMIGSLAPMLAPSVGSFIVQYAPSVGSFIVQHAPSVGSFIVQFASWHMIFALLGIFGLMLLSMMLWGLPETAKLNENASFNLFSVLKNYASIIKDGRFMILVLTFALPLSSLFAYITTASFVFQDYFHLTQQQFGVVFGINVLGSTTFSIINAKIVKKISPYTVLQYAFLAMIFFVILMIIVSFLQLGFVLFEACLFMTMGMIGFIAPNATILAMDRFRQKSGAASAVLGTTQFAIAGIVSFLAGALHANTPETLSAMMSFCILLGWLAYLLLHRHLFKKAKKALGIK